MHIASRNTALQDQGLLRAACGLTVVILLLMGLSYSLVGTAVAGYLFPRQAGGSLLIRDGQIRGSSLLSQPFADARYFQPRPSASAYDPMAAAGSNQARSNPDLRHRLAEAAVMVAERDGVAVAEVPADLITQSGGGLDPHVSPEGARLQIARVAWTRGLTAGQVSRLVDTHTEMPDWGVLGQARVNVLELNLALDAIDP